MKKIYYMNYWMLGFIALSFAIGMIYPMLGGGFLVFISSCYPVIGMFLICYITLKTWPWDAKLLLLTLFTGFAPWLLFFLLIQFE